MFRHNTSVTDGQTDKHNCRSTHRVCTASRGKIDNIHLMTRSSHVSDEVASSRIQPLYRKVLSETRIPTAKSDVVYNVTRPNNIWSGDIVYNVRPLITLHSADLCGNAVPLECWVRRLAASVCLYVRVCSHDKTKTAESTTTKLCTGIVHHDTRLPINIRSIGQRLRSQGQKVENIL